MAAYSLRCAWVVAGGKPAKSGAPSSRRQCKIDVPQSTMGGRFEPDLLVVVTAGGRPIDAIPGPIPSNARLASYLPFEWVLPKVDVFVTNGGYGSVNQAMSFGIPLVTAGLTEDKADVNARVAWSGVGIDLATNEPTPRALREAVRTVLDRPNYRSGALLMADEFDGIDTRSEILRIVSQVSHISDEDGLRRGEVA
jgi:UDP:flavonoid glycosyltransferase YjiC (YdhE family)